MDAVAPRSTSSHCGSLNALDQRVPVLPSTAADAGNDAFSTDDAVAVLPCDSRVAASALWAVPASSAAVRATAAARVTRTRERERRHVSVCGRSLMPVLSGERAFRGSGPFGGRAFRGSGPFGGGPSGTAVIPGGDRQAARQPGSAVGQPGRALDLQAGGHAAAAFHAAWAAARPAAAPGRPGRRPGPAAAPGQPGRRPGLTPGGAGGHGQQSAWHLPGGGQEKYET